MVLVVAAKPVACPREGRTQLSTFGIGKLVCDQFEGLADIEAGERGGGEAVLERIGFVERAVAMLQRAPNAM